MTDRISKAARSALMGRIRRANTKPEMQVRGLLHALGYRFRTQLKGVPGRPDIAFSKKKKAILVHGCFWHAHEGCPTARVPKTRSDFWKSKFAKNRERDKRLLLAAAEMGWESLVVWECELCDPKLGRRLSRFLGSPRTGKKIR